MNSGPRLIAVMGPTASGKTALAEKLSDLLGAQLINADAFMVYRGLDIGTNKPLCKERYTLLDLKNPNEDFGVGEWVTLAAEIVTNCVQKGQSVIVVGGTGLYIRALTERWTDLHEAPSQEVRDEIQARLEANGLEALVQELTEKSDSAHLVDLKNPVRVTRALERLQASANIQFNFPNIPITKIAFETSIESLLPRIQQRTHEMLIGGWIEEVRALLKEGVNRKAPAMRAIGYGSVLDFLDNLVNLQELEEDVVLQTRQYAKRQITWLRTEPNLNWVRMNEANDLEGLAMSVLQLS